MESYSVLDRFLGSDEKLAEVKRNDIVVFTGSFSSDPKYVQGIRVMNSAEAVEAVREAIAARDEQSRRIAHEFNEPLPDWVGKD